MNELETLRMRLVREGKPFFSLIETNLYAHSYKPEGDLIKTSVVDYLLNHEYQPDPKGSLSLRQAIASTYPSVGPEDVIITSGSSESYLLLFDEIVGRGKKILISRPTYPLLEELIKRSGNDIFHYPRLPQKDWQIDLGFVEVMASSEIGAIVIVSPDNPTGKMIGDEELETLDLIASKFNIPLIYDEVFDHYPLGNRAHKRLNSPLSRVFYLNGASKSLTCPDLKVSWIVVSGPDAREASEKLELANDNILSASPLNQKICLDLIHSPKKPRTELLKDLKANLAYLHSSIADLEGIKVLEPEGGFHACILIDRSLISSDTDLAVELLEKHGIYLHPGAYYRLGEYGLVISLVCAPELFSQRVRHLKKAFSVELKS